MNRFITSLSAVVLTLTLSATVSAASMNVNFTSQSLGTNGSHSFSYNDGENAISVTGWSASNSASIRQINVTQSSGWGLYTAGGTHAITNQYNQGTDQNQMLMLDFGRAVTLDSFNLSWTTHKNGVPNYGSVLAYTDSTPFVGFNGLSWESLLNNGFTHAGDPNGYKNMHENQTVSVLGGLSSQFWLIGAINPIFGGTTDGVRDAFKLGSVSFTTVDVSEVPLPAAAWLFLTGLAGMTWIRKRKAKNSLDVQAA